MGAGRGAEMGNGSGAGAHLNLTCVVFRGTKGLPKAIARQKGVGRTQEGECHVHDVALGSTTQSASSASFKQR